MKAFRLVRKKRTSKINHLVNKISFAIPTIRHKSKNFRIVYMAQRCSCMCILLYVSQFLQDLTVLTEVGRIYWISSEENYFFNKFLESPTIWTMMGQ
jgi:hypothetical protein